MKKIIFVLVIVSMFASCISYTPLDTLLGTVSIQYQNPYHTVVMGTELTAVYDGPEQVSFQWYRDNNLVSGATYYRFVPWAPGVYTVYARAPGYAAKRSNAITVIDPNPPPVAQPRPTPRPVPQPVPQPVPRPTPQPVPQPVPQPTPQPTPQPVPQPTPQPVPQPVPQPTPQPPAPAPQPPAPTPQPPAPAPQPPAPAPTPPPAAIGVSISPANPTVAVGSPLQLTATVTGTANTRVTWSVGSNSDATGAVGNGTSINNNGRLTISANERNTVLYVKATSVADTTKSAVVAVTVILGNQGQGNQGRSRSN